MAAPADLDRTDQLVDERHLEAGRNYLHALEKLGLDPAVLAWAREPDTDRIVLVLVTAFFDHAGPLDVSRVLFRAYNAAATPQEIDPFIVRLHSPRQSFADHLIKALKQKIEIVTNMRPRTDIREMPGTVLILGDLEIPIKGVLKWPRRIPSTSEVVHKWQRFVQNVDRLAA